MHLAVVVRFQVLVHVARRRERGHRDGSCGGSSIFELWCGCAGIMVHLDRLARDVVVETADTAARSNGGEGGGWNVRDERHDIVQLHQREDHCNQISDESAIMSNQLLEQERQKRKDVRDDKVDEPVLEQECYDRASWGYPGIATCRRINEKLIQREDKNNEVDDHGVNVHDGKDFAVNVRRCTSSARDVDGGNIGTGAEDDGKLAEDEKGEGNANVPYAAPDGHRANGQVHRGDTKSGISENLENDVQRLAVNFPVLKLISYSALGESSTHVLVSSETMNPMRPISIA